MKYFSFFLLFLVFSVACNNKAQENESIQENFDCKKGKMKRADIEMGKDEAPPYTAGLDSNFVILVDTNLKATNFISYFEEYDRQYNPKLADSIHLINNTNQQQVWLINNSSKTIAIKMQDWKFICVLQAQTKNKKWAPIQYWEFSGCGNSYYFKNFPPNTANSFITKLPTKGDFATKLRYKLLGKDTFYYSNEFDGRIDYCEFVEDSSSYIHRGKIMPHYKLDTLINLL